MGYDTAVLFVTNDWIVKQGVFLKMHDHQILENYK